MNNLILKGDIAYSEKDKTLKTLRNGYVVCEDGICKGIFDEIPEKYKSFTLKDYSGKLIIPGFIDLHIHAPQFAFRSTAMDLELIDWLNRYTFPEEAKYENLEYADKAYSVFADAMRKSATCRGVVFATMHRKATEILMDKMEQTGLISYVGKINMDRESIPELQEKSFLDSASDTAGWLNDISGRYKNTFPIITPRFIPSCSDKLMAELHKIQKDYDLPVQSHLSENPEECQWVQELCPDSRFYADAYAKWDLFGGRVKTVMAHCVYSCDDEIEMIKDRGVFVAHCPTSNMNLSSGIAPIRRYLDLGIRVGLGSDVAGGNSENMSLAIVDAIKASKLYWRLIDDTKSALTFDEAFFCATLGGGEFFGNVGSFLPDYEFDAVVIDDSGIEPAIESNIHDRLERAVYLSLDSTDIAAKFVAGKEIDIE